MDNVLRVLVLEDEPNDAFLEIAELENAGFICQWDRVDNRESYVEHLINKKYDLILADNNLPTYDGMTALKLFKEQRIDVPFIIISGTIGEESAIEFLKAGATDYVRKDHLPRLELVVRRALGESEERLKRSRAEHALIENEKRYRTLFEKARDAIFILRHEAPQLGGIADANQTAAEMHGYTKEELKTLNIGDLDGKQSAIGLLETIKWLQPDEWIHQEISLIKKDGTVFPVDMSAGLQDLEDGKYIICINRDITDKKQKEKESLELENQLRHAQKLEAIGTLAGGIAHDFNNILSVIIGFIELIMISENAIDPSLKEHIQSVSEAANRAKELVRQILAFSRKSDREKRTLDLSLLTKETVKFLKASLPATIEIHQSILAKGRMVYADPSQLHQVLMNLCTNAAQAMKNTGGILEISLSDADPQTLNILSELGFKAHRYIEWAVRDTGDGMTPEVIERIFDPYFTTKRPGEGTGLGLAVTHGIIKSHNGTILVSSEPGKGSTFKVYLPVYVEPLGEKIIVAPEDIPIGTERIIIVDDEQEIVNISSSMLRKLGYTVSSFTNSLEAADYFKQNPDTVDLIVTDMTMPGITGIQFAEEVSWIMPNLPIILCTGFQDMVNHSEFHDSGIKEILIKPLSFHVLAQAVRKAIDEAGKK